MFKLWECHKLQRCLYWPVRPNAETLLDSSPLCVMTSARYSLPGVSPVNMWLVCSAPSVCAPRVFPETSYSNTLNHTQTTGATFNTTSHSKVHLDSSQFWYFTILPSVCFPIWQGFQTKSTKSIYFWWHWQMEEVPCREELWHFLNLMMYNNSREHQREGDTRS